jgi:hypothetical protein
MTSRTQRPTAAHATLWRPVAHTLLPGATRDGTETRDFVRASHQAYFRHTRLSYPRIRVLPFLPITPPPLPPDSWSVGQRASSDVYHTKRMQRLSCVRWSMDAAYLLSGSGAKARVPMPK